jgi:hypothetical protein
VLTTKLKVWVLPGAIPTRADPAGVMRSQCDAFIVRSTHPLSLMFVLIPEVAVSIIRPLVPGRPVIVETVRVVESPGLSVAVDDESTHCVAKPLPGQLMLSA